VIDTIREIKKPPEDKAKPNDCTAGGQFVCDCNGNRIGAAPGSRPSASVSLIEDPVFFGAGFAASRILSAGATIAGTTGGSRITLYHGSDVASVQSIVSNGIDKAAARAVGGGDVFWATADKDLAMCFARANPVGGAPSIAGFTIQEATLKSLIKSKAIMIDPTGAYMVKNWNVFNKAVTKRFVVE
jgi:hypothetical protein